VTSPNPGDGKTTTTLNLAVVLAQAGRSVAVVDGNLRHPKVQTYLGLEGQLGLSDIVRGKTELDAGLRSSADGLIRVLPSGPFLPYASELLSSPRARGLLEELKRRFEVVLVDSPPILSVADATVLAHATDGVLLVVRSGRTERADLTLALDSLEAVEGRLVGVILNMADERGPGTNYSDRQTVQRKVVPMPMHVSRRPVRASPGQAASPDSTTPHPSREV